MELTGDIEAKFYQGSNVGTQLTEKTTSSVVGNGTLGKLLPPLLQIQDEDLAESELAFSSETNGSANETIDCSNVTDSPLSVNLIMENTDKGDNQAEPESAVIAEPVTVELDKQIEMLDFSGNKSEQEPVNVNSSVPPLQDEDTYFTDFCVELARRLFPSDCRKQRYTKGCIWSPDGTCLLLPVHMDGMHIVELPTDLLVANKLSKKRAVSKLPTAVHIREGGTVYDCAWYPQMSSQSPETCCWVASRQHEPIHLWDAYHGDLRASYRGYDDVDEVESAISVAFSNDGNHIFGGYKKTIKLFDTNVPGRPSELIKVKNAVSCFTQRADSRDCVTAGSWNGNIQHFDTRALHLGALFTLYSHTAGITWLKYALSRNHWNLYSGARKDDRILQWDMRNYSRPVREFRRSVSTNQRIYFDITSQNHWMASGDTEGYLNVWDLHGGIADFKLALHNDCCNGVNFHPFQPIVASSSGQYHFVDIEEKKTNSCKQDIMVDYENAVVLLWFGEREEDVES